MTMHRRLVALSAVLAFALLSGGCKDSNGGGGGGGVTPDVTINIVANAAHLGMSAFGAASGTVHVGNVVRMHNGDSITHNIQPDSGTFPSWGSISGGGNADVTATVAGSFPFHCTVSGHTMTGTLVVVP
jgi:plastocyanin